MVISGLVSQEIIQRRQNLLNKIKEKHPDTSGLLLLFSNLEIGPGNFIQESSFYYFTEVNEPAIVLASDLNNWNLYIPNCDAERKKWISSCIGINDDSKKYLVESIKYLGEPIKGYEFSPFFSQESYSSLLALIKETISKGGKIFTINSTNNFEQKFILEQISKFLPNFIGNIVDISDLVASLRRTKSMHEIELLYKAVDITLMGQEAAVQTIAHDKFEYEVQAAIEYVFKFNNATLSFPSIVGSGKNSTVLHYTQNDRQMKNGDLVLIDIGASYGHYCGDITRTYPVSGKFTTRQKEIYNLVLETQEYIASIAKSGMWLSNKDHAEQSLNHLAREFLKERGMDQYFFHSLGHYLGLDTHDVGSYAEPLKEGDIITIEPGIYIAAENIGVRIEDNYWITQEGAVCLSEQFPKTAEDIEAFMKTK